MQTTNRPTASLISRILAESGFCPLPSGTPRTREGIRVTGGIVAVSVIVDFDDAKEASYRSEELESALNGRGYEIRRSEPNIFSVR